MQIETEPKHEQFLPWSLIDAEVSDVLTSPSAVTTGTGTATHTANQPKDLHVDDA